MLVPPLHPLFTPRWLTGLRAPAHTCHAAPASIRPPQDAADALPAARVAPVVRPLRQYPFITWFLNSTPPHTLRVTYSTLILAPMPVGCQCVLAIRCSDQSTSSERRAGLVRGRCRDRRVLRCGNFNMGFSSKLTVFHAFSSATPPQARQHATWHPRFIGCLSWCSQPDGVPNSRLQAPSSDSSLWVMPVLSRGQMRAGSTHARGR